MNAYGKRCIRDFLSVFAGTQTVIVSGGAYGGDTCSHEVALENNIPTVVVLGSGHLHIYPAENKNLFNKIVDNNGMIVSQFSMQQEPTKGTFPVRNNTIAGMSSTLFVAQAGCSSGTLITAQCALEYGKNVCAVPGYYDDELSQGCLELIHQGATMVYKPEQLFHVVYPHGVLGIQKTVANWQKKPITIEDQILVLCSQKACNVNEIATFCKQDEEAIHRILYTLLAKKKLQCDIFGNWQSY